jgi:hypothetical protein
MTCEMAILLDVKDGVRGVHCRLVLGGLANEALLVGEGDERGRREASLLIGNWRPTMSALLRDRQV